MAVDNYKEFCMGCRQSHPKHLMASIDYPTGRMWFCVGEGRDCPERAAKEIMDTAKTYGYRLSVNTELESRKYDAAT